MSLTLNSEPVISASLHLPLNGAWSAELQVSSDVLLVPGDAATLLLPGDVSYVGRVANAGIFGARLHVRLTGGSAEWGRPIDVKHYRNTDGDQAMRDLGIQTEAPLELDLPFWTRPLGTIGDAVQALATLAQVNWRVLSNGTVRIRAEEPFTIEPEAVEISRDDARGIVEVAPDVAVIQPGVTLGADQIGDVIYTFGESGLRCRYYTQQRAKLRGGLERLIRWVMRDAFYLGQFTCQVVSQAGDGTLDLLPDDQRLRAQGLQSVPIRHGLPGVTVTVAPGARVLLGFDGGDPRQPYAALWHEGDVQSITVNASVSVIVNAPTVELGGSQPVALAQLVDSRLTAMQAVIDTHVHTSAAPASPTTAPVPPIVWPATPLESQVLKSS
jgi:hypothetical protein